MVDFDLYRGIAQREWSGNYGFFRPSLIQSIDYVCIIGKRAWVLEGKKDPNHEAIGQVLVYSYLFKEDYPIFEEIKMGIACKEPSPLNEPTCSKLGISIFAIEREKSLDFKDKPEIKNKSIEYPEPADNSFLLK